jgi:hypothetical protein
VNGKTGEGRSYSGSIKYLTGIIVEKTSIKTVSFWTPLTSLEESTL